MREFFVFLHKHGEPELTRVSPVLSKTSCATPTLLSGNRNPLPTVKTTPPIDIPFTPGDFSLNPSGVPHFPRRLRTATSDHETPTQSTSSFCGCNLVETFHRSTPTDRCGYSKDGHQTCSRWVDTYSVFLKSA